MSFLRKPASAANPQHTAYRTGQNYPVQENTGEAASNPTQHSRMPSAQRLSVEDYFTIMGEQLSHIGAQVAQTNALIKQAEDRNAVVRVTRFDTDYAVPNSDRWRTAYITRPSMSEYLYTTGLTPKDLTIVWDESQTTIVPYYGQIIIPLFDFHKFYLHNTGPGGVGTYPSTWAIDIVFTTRQYNPTQWAVSA